MADLRNRSPLSDRSAIEALDAAEREKPKPLRGHRLCPGCGVSRPYAAFRIEKPGGGILRGYVCKQCRIYGPKALVRDETTPAPALAVAPLSIRDQALLQALASGLDLGAAEKSVGYRIGGAVRRKLLLHEDFRLAFQSILLEAGVDRAKLAEVALDGMKAEDVRWNPEEKEFQAVGANHTARLRAADLAAKWLDLVPRTHQPGSGSGATVVVVNTNIGTGPRSVDTGVYEIEVNPQPAEGAQ